MEAFTETLVRVIETSPWLAPLAAFVGGLLTAANPCVIAAVPLMMAFLAGQEGRGGLLRSFLLSLTFSIGLTITFGLMFLTAWAASSVLKEQWWVYVAAAVCLLMGLHLLGVLRFSVPAPGAAQPRRKGFVGALLLGLLFGLISLPCAGPILAVVLALVPVHGPVFGGTLLVSYSIGHCALILIGGTSMGAAQKMIDSKGLRRVNDWAKRIAGVVIIGVGIYLLLK